MRRILLLFACLLALPSTAFATWSILAVDRATGRVVMAAASCVNTTDEAMKTAIAVVVPGKGIAACQAAADNTHQNQMLVFNELQKGTNPDDIIEMLSRGMPHWSGLSCDSQILFSWLGSVSP